MKKMKRRIPEKIRKGIPLKTCSESHGSTSSDG